MGKFVADAALDDGLDNLATATLLTVCTTQPATYADATGALKLADVVVTAGIGGGDFTLANGDVSGRKLTVAAQSAVPIDTSGDAQHIALVRVSDTTLLFVTTCTLQALTASGTVDIPAWDIEMADPT